jgi:hypothetical protein
MKGGSLRQIKKNLPAQNSLIGLFILHSLYQMHLSDMTLLLFTNLPIPFKIYPNADTDKLNILFFFFFSFFKLSVKKKGKKGDNKQKLNSNYVTGFSDAESTFVVFSVKSQNYKIG